MEQGCHVLHLKKQQGLRVRKTAGAQALDVESAKATVHRTHRLRRKQLAPRLGLNKASENSILSPRGFGMQAYGEEDGILLRDFGSEIKGKFRGPPPVRALPLFTTRKSLPFKRKHMQRYQKSLTFFTLLIGGMRVASGETDNPLRPLVETSAERLHIAERVALAKWDNGVAVEDGPREAMVIQAAVKDGTAVGLDSTQVEAFFRGQIEPNKLVQYALLADWRREGRAPVHASADLVKEVGQEL